MSDDIFRRLADQLLTDASLAEDSRERERLVEEARYWAAKLDEPSHAGDD